MAKKRGKAAGKKTAAKKSSKTPVIVFGAIVVLVIIVLVFALRSGGSEYAQQDIDEFAKCLTENNVVMYGAFWCPHCAKTKKNFGESFRYVTYVECDPRGDNEQSELCIEKGIDKYDTWEFASGERIISEPTFEELAEKSGCPAPEAQN